MKRRKTAGKEAFEAYYAALFGSRWDTLRAALLSERRPVPFAKGLLKPYFMDEGSILAAEALPIQSGDTVLDMCAAPGGKTLVIASRLAGSGHLVSNDRSAARRQRLASVVAEYLPPAWRETVSVTGHDSTTWGLFEKDAYDKVLLDAPCSSERHVIADPSALDAWSPARPKRLAAQQFAMLCAALDAVKVGGLVLYSTCALNPGEDEDVIARLERKREGRWETVETDVECAEGRTYGSIIMPDAAGGKGPLYFCLLRRIA